MSLQNFDISTRGTTFYHLFITATGFLLLFYIYASNASRVTYQLINDAVVGNRCIHIVCSCTDFMCFLLTNVAVPPGPCVTSLVFSCLLCFHLGRDSSFPILVFLFLSLYFSQQWLTCFIIFLYGLISVRMHPL